MQQETTEHTSAGRFPVRCVMSRKAPLEKTQLLTEEEDDQHEQSPACNTHTKGRRVAVCVVIAVTLVITAILIVAVFLFLRLPSTKDKEFWTNEFISKANNETIAEFLATLTNQSHLAGTEGDFFTAEYVREKMSQFGIPKVELQAMNVLLSYPIEDQRLVQLLPGNGYDGFNCSLKEIPVSEDPTSEKPAPPSYLGFSGSGDVTAELVYANYGQREDFVKLQESGINVSGKIVIVRYGKIFRGNKVLHAETYGASACIIYSDPVDDGFVRGEVYPNGPWRPASGVQRGTILTSIGDPLTPGWPSTDTAPRLNMSDVYDPKFTDGQPLSKIPSIPISYGDAEPLLRQLSGTPVPPEWQGGLNFTYHFGPGPARVRVRVKMNTTTAKIWNVIGKIVGSEEPDRMVIVGNHRDAWTFGAIDPSSGTSSLLEISRVFGTLLSQGWKPKRTIWLCSWDAEEFGLIGSSEFVELHEKRLFQQAIAYLNVDISVSGNPTLFAAGIPSLTDFFSKVISGIPVPPGSPKEAHSMYDLWESPKVLKGEFLGGGSDYAPFVQFLGIPSISIEFAKTAGIIPYDGVYHSIYDTFRWSKKFADPEFQFSKSATQIIGSLVIQLCDSQILPFNFTSYGMELLTAVPNLEKLAEGAGMELDFHFLTNALNSMVSAGKFLENYISSNRDKILHSPLLLRQVNDKQIFAERNLLYLRGFSGRPSLRHVVYVSGLYNNYQSVPFSPVADAIAEGDGVLAQHQIQLLSVVIQQMADFLSEQF